MGNVGGIFVHPHHGFLARIQLLLKPVSRVGYFHLREAFFNGGNHTAHCINLVNIVPRLFFHFVGERLDEIRAGQGINGVGHAGFFGQNLLRAQRDFHGMLGRKTEHFIQRICVQRLCAAQDRCQSFHGGPDNIIVRLLSRQRTAGRLRVKAQPQGTGIFGMKTVPHNLRPHAAGRAHFAYLFKKIDMRIEKEGQPRRKVVHIHFFTANHVIHIFDAVTDGERQFLDGRGSRFADVIAADADGVPARNIFCAEFHGVADEFDGRFRGAHECFLCDKFLKHVVLDGAADFGKRYPLDICSRAVHGP